MNKHIELVKRWLAGEVVSVEALKANADAAVAADVAADVAAAANAAAAAYAAYAAAADAEAAAYWVKQYERFNKELNK